VEDMVDCALIVVDNVKALDETFVDDEIQIFY
jgi:hypothetical protein